MLRLRQFTGIPPAMTFGLNAGVNEGRAENISATGFDVDKFTLIWRGVINNNAFGTLFATNHQVLTANSPLWIHIDPGNGGISLRYYRTTGRGHWLYVIPTFGIEYVFVFQYDRSDPVNKPRFWIRRYGIDKKIKEQLYDLEIQQPQNGTTANNPTAGYTVSDNDFGLGSRVQYVQFFNRFLNEIEMVESIRKPFSIQSGLVLGLDGYGIDHSPYRQHATLAGAGAGLTYGFPFLQYDEWDLESYAYAGNLDNSITVEITSDFEVDSIITILNDIEISIFSDFENDSTITISINQNIEIVSDFEADSILQISNNINSNFISDFEIDNSISISNTINIEINSDIELDTLIQVEVLDNSNNINIISDLELESIISITNNIVIEMLSDILIETFIVCQIEELSTSFVISQRYNKQIKSALRLIAKNGQKVIWRIVSESQNVLEPWKASIQTTENKVVSICFLPTNKQTLESLSFRPNIEIPQGCVLGLMGNNGFEPNLKDVVLRNGVKLSLFYIDKLSPNGQNVLYTLLLKE